MKYTILAITTTALLAMPIPALAEDPANKADDTWISVSGTVKSVSPDTFILEYDNGTIPVEMDDGDNDADAYKVVVGDKVTVNGIIDDDLFERKTIEASSVYVEGLNTYFYASPVDEEDTFITYTTPVVVSSVVLQGTVTGVDGREFTLDTGTRMVTVDTVDMTYNPMDDEGFQKIKKGDRVSVSGMFDADLFEARKFDATSIVTLSKAD